MYSCGPPHMDVQKQDDQHELTYSNYVRTQDVTLKTYRRRWLIGRSGERGSGISVLAARHDDDDDYVINHPNIIQYILYNSYIIHNNNNTNRSIWLIGRILKDSILQGKSEHGSNFNEVLPQPAQISRTNSIITIVTLRALLFGGCGYYFSGRIF